MAASYDEDDGKFCSCPLVTALLPLSKRTPDDVLCTNSKTSIKPQQLSETKFQPFVTLQCQSITSFHNTNENKCAQKK